MLLFLLQGLFTNQNCQKIHRFQEGFCMNLLLERLLLMTCIKALMKTLFFSLWAHCICVCVSVHVTDPLGGLQGLCWALLCLPFDLIGAMELWLGQLGTPGQGLWGYKKPCLLGILRLAPCGPAALLVKQWQIGLICKHVPQSTVCLMVLKWWLKSTVGVSI